MSSPNLVTDCTAKCQFPVKRKIGYSKKTTFFEDDVSQEKKFSDVKHLNPITLVYAAQSDSEKASFEAFFDARNAAADPGVFYWDDVRTGETNILVRFIDEYIEFAATDVRTWSWTCQLRKVAS